MSRPGDDLEKSRRGPKAGKGPKNEPRENTTMRHGRDLCRQVRCQKNEECGGAPKNKNPPSPPKGDGVECKVKGRCKVAGSHGEIELGVGKKKIHPWQRLFFNTRKTTAEKWKSDHIPKYHPAGKTIGAGNGDGNSKGKSCPVPLFREKANRDHWTGERPEQPDEKLIVKPLQAGEAARTFHRGLVV